MNLINTRSGELLKNHTKHKDKTNSVGFCFLNIEDFKPEEAMHFLSGVVSFDVCAIFETSKELNNTYGIYAKPFNVTGNLMEDLMNIFMGFTDSFKADEYCITEYSSKDFKLIKYADNLWKQWGIREEQSELIWKKI